MQVSAKAIAKHMGKIATICCLFFASSCAARRPIGVNYLVPRDCRSEVRLINCDRNSPPNCKHIAATFPKGCEQVAAR